MMRRVAIAGALLLPLAAAASDPLAGRVAGTPVDCITLSRVDGPQIVDAQTILYRETGNRLWRSGPVGDCPALAPLTTLVVDVYGGQLCHNDRFRTLVPGTTIPSAYCRFDRFTPYDRPAGAKR